LRTAIVGRRADTLAGVFAATVIDAQTPPPQGPGVYLIARDTLPTAMWAHYDVVLHLRKLPPVPPEKPCPTTPSVAIPTLTVF